MGPISETFRAAPTWSLDGRGLPAADLRFWKEQLAAFALIGSLAREDAFWSQVAEVRAAADTSAVSWRLARKGGTGRRRKALRRLLVAAAREADPDAGRWAMDRTTIRMWTTVDDPPEGRREHYNLACDYLAVVTEGAELAACRQVERCFECEAASIAGDYCRRHDKRVPIARKRRHCYAIDRLYSFAMPAILGDPPPAADVSPSSPESRGGQAAGI